MPAAAFGFKHPRDSLRSRHGHDGSRPAPNRRARSELYRFVDAQLNDSDRRSLLALHAGCRQAYGTYTYVEIGSHLGGSLQVPVRDPACARIVSIDPRPERQPDEQKGAVHYERNSTERMLANLAAVPDAELGKLETVEATAADLDPARFAASPAFCFVDGEHTDRAVLVDARFCAAVTAPTGVIAFHDMSTVYRGLFRFTRELQEAGTEFEAYLLPHSIFVFELGGGRVLRTPHVTEAVRKSGTRVLTALMDNDPYRQTLERSPLRAWRRMRGSR